MLPFKLGLFVTQGLGAEGPGLGQSRAEVGVKGVCLVHGMWSVVRVAWYVLRGTCCVVRGTCCVVRGTCCVVRVACCVLSR